MKLTLEEFKNLCNDLGFGLTLPEADQDRLYSGLDKKLGWSKSETTAGFIAAYVEAYKYRWKTSPVIDGKSAGIAKRIVTDLGAQVATELIEAYLMMNDMFFVQRRHDLMTFSLNLNSVKIYSERGETISRHELTQADRVDGERQSWDRVKKGLAQKSGLRPDGQ